MVKESIQPGYFLMLMAWWIVPFFAIHLVSYPVHRFLPSFLPFFVAFVVIAAAGSIVTMVENKTGFWERSGRWKRYGILTSSYAAAVVVILLATVGLDYWGFVGYFGGDAAGSFGMLYIPSAIFYVIGGAVLCGALSMRDRRRE